VLWGLANGGATGVRHVMKSLLAEFDLTVGLSGHNNIQDVDETSLEDVA
jgi:isopentenyl diphosphate isomerase/L-lactate dehydrogenase-like FMN-dependent dehydrogenase